MIKSRKMLKKTSRRAIVGPIMGITTLIAFTWLSCHSYSTYGPGGSKARKPVSSMEELVKRSLRDADKHDRYMKAHGQHDMYARERAEETINLFGRE